MDASSFQDREKIYQRLEKIKYETGFNAALYQSGGSTPKALPRSEIL